MLTLFFSNQILRHILKHVKGGGGGQKEYAQGRLAEAILDQETIKSRLLPALEAQ